MESLKFLENYIDINSCYNQTINYGLGFSFFIILAYVLKPPETSIFIVLITLICIPAWSYIMHRTLHNIDEWGILKEFNTHLTFHHAYDKPLPRSLELFLEMITDIFVINLSVIPFQLILGRTILSLSTILLYTLAYSSIHLFNYSIIGTKFHGLHHKTKDKNFTPDMFDHFFGTNYSEEREDLNPTVINLLGTTAVLYYFKDTIHEYEKWLFSQNQEVK